MTWRGADAARVRGDNRAANAGGYLRLLSVMAALMIFATPRVAQAHAHLVKSSPSMAGHLANSPTQIRLWVNEAAEPTMTAVTLTGPNGVVVQLGPVEADVNDPLLLVASIEPALAAGTYTLQWRTVAQDNGHPSRGEFGFAVDGTTATLVALPGTIGTAPAPKSLRRLMATPTAPARRRLPPLDLQDPSVILVRWLNFAAIMMVIGVVGFRVLVVPRLTPRGTVNDLAPFSDRTIERAAGLGLTAAAIALVASVSRLYAQQAVVGHGAYMETILNSFWGHIWLFQLATAIVACVAFAMARLAIGDDHRKFAWIAATVAALLLSASPALSGHAIAAPKHRSISVALDIIHVIAAGAWLGGLFAVTIAGIPAAVAVGGSGEAPRSSTLIAALVNAFRPVALVSATMVMASGAVGGWLRLGSLGALIHSGYGRALLIKLGFVALVLAGGAFNWLRMRGTLSQRDAAAPAVAAFRRSAWLELSAGILVIVATAVLVAARPPIR